MNGAITCLAVDKSGTIFASTAAGYNDGYVYKSTDGNTFIPV
ncbi:hypothetical protein [Spiroplasma ixodetis]|nr:hypothetical protein [Spiroplasma ixodetis]